MYIDAFRKGAGAERAPVSSLLESHLVISEIDQNGIDQSGDAADIHALLAHHVSVVLAHDER